MWKCNQVKNLSIKKLFLDFLLFYSLAFSIEAQAARACIGDGCDTFLGNTIIIFIIAFVLYQFFFNKILKKINQKLKKNGLREITS